MPKRLYQGQQHIIEVLIINIGQLEGPCPLTWKVHNADCWHRDGHALLASCLVAKCSRITQQSDHGVARRAWCSQSENAISRKLQDKGIDITSEDTFLHCIPVEKKPSCKSSLILPRVYFTTFFYNKIFTCSLMLYGIA